MAKDAAGKKAQGKKAEPKAQASKAQGREPAAEGKTVFCVRNQIEKGAEEHLGCAYCFGKRREVIEKGERKEFCDFDPEKDPTSFGFPETSSRNLKG